MSACKGIALINLGYERGIKMYDSVRDCAFTSKETSKVCCAECKNYIYGLCMRWNIKVTPDTTCGDGERKKR